MKKTEYLKLLHEIRWEEGRNIDFHLIPAININLGASQSKLATGASKFGGKPDLPIGIEWPLTNGKPMVFLAQINLQEIGEFDLDNVLPSTGILFYFIADPDGLETEHKIIHSIDTELIEREFPKTLIYQSSYCRPMVFEAIHSFIARESLEYESLSENDQGAYIYELNRIFLTSRNTQMLGHVHSERSDIKFHWALRATGIDASEIRDSHIEEINSLRTSFINLLQFSPSQTFLQAKSFFRMGYIGIQRTDLEQENFDNTILTFAG